MKCRYVGDSCCEFPKEFLEKHDCRRVALTITVGDDLFIDDDSFDQAVFLKKVAAYPKCPHSACPSPEQYLEAFKGDADIIFVSTLSAELSGSYNSALLAKTLYEEEHKDNKLIHIFNSCSASGGEAQVLMKAAALMDAGKSFEETVRITEEYLYNDMQTYFVLEDLETLRKNGRLSRMKAMAANALNIKLVCKGNHGIIEQCALARGMKRALGKMVEISLTAVRNTEERILFITHCNCLRRAEAVLAEYLERTKFAASYIVDQAGISSLYAGDGGVIVTF